ncbi:MAG: SH3 domain-containing protein [Rhodothermales bacterium]|nr:SH3 domain-containing protein [Rhodothermales bacterium]
MRVLFILLLATLTSTSLTSCSLLNGGERANRTDPAQTIDNSDAELPPENIEQPAEYESTESIGQQDVELAERTTLYSTASLNVRSGPGTVYPVVAGLSYGDSIEASGLDDGWYELFSDGQSIGFAHSNYLSAEKPAPLPRDALPSASFETGLFGVSLPAGSSLVVSSPLTETADARETYRVPMAYEEIRGFYVRELSALGWKPFESETETTLNYRKGDLAISVVVDMNGQRFTLSGGQR